MTNIKFGTDGWRDLMYDRFNLPNVLQVVQAIAKYVLDNQGEKRGLIVGFDARFFSDLFAEEAAKVLAANGIHVYLGERDFPTPVVAFAVKLHHAFGAIMFTASHNPPEYNGIKFIPEYAGPASPEITKEIEKNLLADLKPLTGTKNGYLIERFDPTSDYLKQLRNLINVEVISKAGLNVIVDPMWATGRGFLAQLLSGSPLTELHNKRDPLFGGCMPDPQEKYLNELKNHVTRVPNSIGLATDGDADRFGIVDSDGSYITPNQVISLLMSYLIKQRGFKGVVTRSVATTHFIDKLGSLYGVETIETPVGFKYIGEQMRIKQVIIGGEESGGLSILGHIPEKDGILAGALAAEMMAVTQKPLLSSLKELADQVGSLFSQRVDLHLSEEAKRTILKRCQENPPGQIGGQAVVELRTMDGYKFILDNQSWVLVRPSGTEPLIRVYLEASSTKELEQLVSATKQMVNQWGQ